MAVIARAANRVYPISEAWFKSEDADVPKYVDVREILNKESAYVDWVIANDPNLVSPNTKAGHSAAMNFTLNGIRVGETDKGPEIHGRFKGNTFDTSLKYVGGINHPERYSRIYRKGTLARHLAFVGVDAND